MVSNERRFGLGWGRLLGPLGLALLAVWAMVSGLAAMSRPEAIQRPQDPVILSGADFPAFDGVAIAELALYRYQAGSWQPIPFQVDELTVNNSYTTTEDGLLDSNDQLVFMAFSAGEVAAITNWVNDVQAQSNPRFVITATDPLDPAGQGWAYLYRSSTLPHANNSYVSWDKSNQTITAISYTASFTPQQFLGLSSLSLNNNPADLLDRQKIRGQVSVLLFGQPISTTIFDEETILGLITQPVTITLPIVGPIRAVGGNETQGFAFYGSRIDLSLALDLSDVDIAPFTVLHFDFIRVSLDWNDPAGSGLSPATYYNNNGIQVAIDGLPDNVPTSPPANWVQVSGAAGGLVTVGDIDPANGTLQNYYKDQATPDPNDKGDNRSYGDAGFRLDDPNGLIAVNQLLYILPGNSGNVGQLYQNLAANPITIETMIELYEAPAGTPTPTIPPTPSPTPTITPTPMPNHKIHLPVVLTP